MNTFLLLFSTTKKRENHFIAYLIFLVFADSWAIIKRKRKEKESSSLHISECVAGRIFLIRQSAFLGAVRYESYHQNCNGHAPPLPCPKQNTCRVRKIRKWFDCGGPRLVVVDGLSRLFFFCSLSEDILRPWDDSRCNWSLGSYRFSAANSLEDGSPSQQVPTVHYIDDGIREKGRGFILTLLVTVTGMLSSIDLSSSFSFSLFIFCGLYSGAILLTVDRCNLLSYVVLQWLLAGAWWVALSMEAAA